MGIRKIARLCRFCKQTVEDSLHRLRERKHIAVVGDGNRKRVTF
jgi:hypothetical protein